MAKKPVKKPVKKDVIPQEILVKLKRVKAKFFKDDTLKEVREVYLDLYKEDKIKHKDKKWSECNKNLICKYRYGDFIKILISKEKPWLTHPT